MDPSQSLATGTSSSIVRLRAFRRKKVQFGSRLIVLTLVMASVSPDVGAQSDGTAATQSPARGERAAWSLRGFAAGYFFPDDENYVQPTVAYDRGAWHVEGRYNYEDRGSVSGFLGWTFEWGKGVTFQLTPMAGAVVGNTDGIVPALELGLAWRRFELYSEAEYVIDINRRQDRFLYNWVEASIWATEWLRGRLLLRGVDQHHALNTTARSEYDRSADDRFSRGRENMPL